MNAAAFLLPLLLALATPVRFPDVSGLEPAVAEQMGMMRGLLAAAEAQGEPGRLAVAYGDLGQIYLAYGFNDGAADCFANAAALDPKDFRWPYLLGAAQQAAGRLDEAAAAFGKALELSPDTPAGYVHLGEIRLLQGKLDEAEAALNQALKTPATVPAARSFLGQVALARRDYKTAAEQLEAALAAVPEANRLHHPLAMAYRGLGDMKKAEEHLALAGQVGLRPPDPLLDAVTGLRVGERVAVMRGRVAAQAGRYQEAAAEFRRALTARPESVEARVNLGSVLALSGDRTGALEQLREALRLDPANFTARFNLGSLLLEGGAPGEARSHLEAAVAARPEDAEARRLLAQSMRDTGHPLEALEPYRRAIELMPGDETARLGEAETLVRLGRYRDAQTRLEEGLTQIPTSGLLTHALARLLAGCPDLSLRDGARALTLAQLVWQARPEAVYAETLALASAELGRCEDAARWQKTAIDAAQKQGQEGRVEDMNRKLAGYEKGAPCRP